MLSLIERCGRGWSVSLVRGVRSSVASSFRFLPIAFHERLFSSSHNQEMLYVPFATDFKREHASIMFWVSKNTNLKEVNVNIRVSLSILQLICVESLSSFLEFFLRLLHSFQ